MYILNIGTSKKRFLLEMFHVFTSGFDLWHIKSAYTSEIRISTIETYKQANCAAKHPAG
jgi:hypothetical protein